MASVAQIREQYRKGGRPGSPAAIPKSARPGRRALEDQLARVEGENHDLSRAIYEAAQVQRKLCGPRYCRTASYEFASEIFPVRHLSGDFISVIELEGDLVFAIGDIAGKGLRAGMWFTHVIGAIRRAMSGNGDPASALSAADCDLFATGLECPLTTVFLARLTPSTGELTYSNAGHPPALVVRGTGEVEQLIAGGPVLGAFPRASFVNGHTRLAGNDTLVAYSDGIAESRNESGIELGSERLAHVTRTLAGLNAGAMLFSILAALETFAGPWRREDDIALAVLRRLDSLEMDRERLGLEGRGPERYAV
ncbi:MAG: SpoIIE family protein phosphatase [Acidobacteria bacterium]|nr:SpoIIE family protein phosphatase [Acidobacteriota bacterium]